MELIKYDKEIHDVLVFVPNEFYDEEHKKMVSEHIRIYGEPVIFGHYEKKENIFYSIDGSHRIGICYELGIVPKLYSLPLSEKFYTDHSSNFSCSSDYAPSWVKVDYKEHEVGEYITALYDASIGVKNDPEIYTIKKALLCEER